MTGLNFDKYASGSGGVSWAQAQTMRQRVSFTRCFSAGLFSLSLSLGVVVPTQAAIILDYPGSYSSFKQPLLPITINDSDALDLAGGTDFTLAACANSLVKYNSGHSGTIFSKRGLYNGYFLGIDGEASSDAENGTVKFMVHDKGITRTIRSKSHLDTGKPYAAMIVYKSGTASIYINGVRDGSYSIQSPPETLRDLVIGRENQHRIDDPNSTHEPHVWNGTLSHLQIHNVALSDEKIKEFDATCRNLLDLTVTSPTGGTVTGQDISCGTQCKTQLAKDTSVVLTATPSAGYVLTGWGGACSGTAATCNVTMSQAQTVTATFKPLYNLNVTKTGTGAVSSSPTGINCGNDCTKYPAGTTVTLTATPGTDYTFTGWGGACSGTATTCRVTMTQVQNVTATFALKPSITMINGGACIIGRGQGVGFSWLLRNNSSGNTVASNLNATTRPDEFETRLAARLVVEITDRDWNNTVSSVNNCINLQGIYTLFVGPPGATPQCEVTTTGCRFNPLIKFVPRSQMLTSITGFVWNDLNKNGLQDLHETYLPEWTVVLKKPNGVETSTVSDADGYYEFTGLTAGNYTVTVETKTGAIYTTSQSVTQKVDSINIPGLANFGIETTGVKLADPPSGPVPPGTGTDDNSDKEMVVCPLYGVQDQDLNDSILFTVNPADQQVTQLGETCVGCDIEALDIQPVTNVLYLASGNNARQHPNGHLYKLDPQTGELTSIGPTGFEDISSLAFDKQGILWAWAKDAGLVQLDTQTGHGTLIIASSAAFADLTWNAEGTTLYGAIGTELWSYVPATQIVTKLCDNLPEKTEAIRTLPTSVLPTGYLLLGAHEDGSLKLHAFHIETCQLDMQSDFVIPYDDVEGLAMPAATCQ